MPAAIEAVNLTKEFRSGKVKALDELNLCIEKGEIFGIIGPNGAGKTADLLSERTLAHSLPGIATVVEDCV